MLNTFSYEGSPKLALYIFYLECSLMVIYWDTCVAVPANMHCCVGSMLNKLFCRPFTVIITWYIYIFCWTCQTEMSPVKWNEVTPLNTHTHVYYTIKARDEKNNKCAERLMKGEKNIKMWKRLICQMTDVWKRLNI